MKSIGVSFKLAGSIFLDPGIASYYDDEHSDGEERWISIGLAKTGVLLAVIYTWTEIDVENVRIRLISARKASRTEMRTYKDRNS